MKIQRIALVLFLLVSALHAKEWAEVFKMIEQKFPDVKNISTDELKKSIEAGEKIILIDVRTKEEFETSHLKNALNISRIENVPYPKDQKIVVYCSVGYRSADFATRLQKLGFTNVYNLKGSIFEWANKGYDLYRNGKKVTAVHPFNKEWGTLLRQQPSVN